MIRNRFRAAVSWLIRQSGLLAFFCFLFALLNGWYVIEGLYQGGGLHGYTIQPGRRGSPHLVSTWTAFVQMLALLGFGSALLGLQIRHALKIGRLVLRPRRTGGKSPDVVVFRSRKKNR